MSQSRHLAAIMFTDIVGFTSLMEKDEKLAMAYREKLKQKMESEVMLHNGRIIKWMGDGVICSFDSAIESIHTATAVQLDMQQKPVVPVRIGIHQADIIFEDKDVHGDGVNIAARLESLAIPGSIFISAKVQDDIKNQNDIETISLGKYVLKNVNEPVEIFAVSNKGLQVPVNKKLEGKGIKYVSKSISIKKKSLLMRSILLLAILLMAGYFFIPPYFNKLNARNKTIPAIQKMVDENFRAPTKAFDMALEAEKFIPKDSALPPDFDSIDAVVAECKSFKEDAQQQADALIMFSCVSRYLSFGVVMKEELEQVQNIWEAPMAGFFSYGEYGKSKTGKYDYHNNTCCLVVLKEK